MKGKYFFKDSTGTSIEIQEFDYDYVRNSLLKVFDKNVQKKYKFNVIVSRTYDGAGMPIFDVRSLDLNEIYYDSTRLCVLEMMLDDIYFGRISIMDLPVPRLQQEYQDYQAGRAKPVVVENSQPAVPAPIVFARKELSENDPRLPAIIEMKSDFDFKPMQVLDWVENFEVCSLEITTSNRELSEEQMNLVKVLQTNSEYISSVFDNLTNVLETLFPLKQTFLQRMLGTQKDIVVKQDEIGTILSCLNNAVKIDPHRFSGVSTMFKGLQDKIKGIKDNVEHGIIGCQYVISTDEDAYEFELRQERLMKLRATTDISEMSLTTVNKRFLNNLSKLGEIQEVLVPLLIVKLQNQASKKVDDETVALIRNMAYRDTATEEIKPQDPPKNP